MYWLHQERLIGVIASLCAMRIAFPFQTTHADDDPPGVREQNVRRVFHNGEHNAFTDLIRWKGKYWLAFRSCPDGHMVFSTSLIIVLSSDDLMLDMACCPGIPATKRAAMDNQSQPCIWRIL